MKNRLHVFLSLFLLFSLSANNLLIALVDLEDKAQDFVLEIKKIELADHPHAFNPSICRVNGKLLLSFRELSKIEDPSQNSISCSAQSRIGLIWLDESFNPISTPQFLNTTQIDDPTISRAEDSRLVTIGDKLFIVYSDNQEEIPTNGGFRMYVTELLCEEEKITALETECLEQFEGERKSRREKNWVPFDYHNNLLFSYSLSPHKVLRPILGSNYCETISKTPNHGSWSWGELRGGTPALLMDGEYLAFFHSSKKMTSVHSKGVKQLHYFMGAYTFSSDPPFEITSMSPEPIIGKGFYHGEEYKPYWGNVRVIFPCGYIYDDAYIWIAYGRQDHEMWIAKLDRKGLLCNLVSVQKAKH